jgi:hypothetical protein
VLTPDQKGAIAEAAISCAAARLGVGVSKPQTVERYDLLFDLRPRLLRVQCKWASRYGDIVIVRCYSARRTREGLLRRTYCAGEIDAIAAYCSELDRCFLLPLELFDRKSQIHLRLSETRNNQRLGVHWAAAFDFAATLGPGKGP